jgi:hypothetical protein
VRRPARHITTLKPDDVLAFQAASGRFVKGNQPGLQRAIYDKINADCGTAPDHASMDYSHGRIIRRSVWVTGAGAGAAATRRSAGTALPGRTLPTAIVA